MRETSSNLLKLNWERRTETIKLSQSQVKKAISLYTSQKISSFELFSKGGANTNYKVTFSNAIVIVLRIYTRDSTALTRETKIHSLIQNKVPIPKFLYINTECEVLPFPFAILEYVPGILFRDLILKDDKKPIESCSYQAGGILTELASFQFKEPGFFEDDLRVKPFEKDQTFFDLLHSWLSQVNIKESLGGTLTKQLLELIQKYKPALIELSQHKNLTHADYDPANILVKKENSKWVISAILDWEFALSSTYYMDIGLMLRFAHRLPEYFKLSFIQGIKDANPSLLQPDWEERRKLMDMVCLLSLCLSNSPAIRPNMYKDIKELLNYICHIL